jgi:putative addiction module component (TIGR02574 family)
MDAIEITEAATSLSPEERARLADTLLRSLDPPESSIDETWGRLAQRRLQELRSGAVQPIPGGDVFERIWKRFAT